jgi:hypothetical protein
MTPYQATRMFWFMRSKRGQTPFATLVREFGFPHYVNRRGRHCHYVYRVGPCFLAGIRVVDQGISLERRGVRVGHCGSNSLSFTYFSKLSNVRLKWFRVLRPWSPQ